jgi:FKBP-type peptidyl-prolyl cis-trans isomerase
MKHFTGKFFLTVSLCALVFGGCKGENKNPSGASAAGFDKDTSYALGMNMGSNFKENGILLDLNEFFQGFKDAMGGGKTRLSAEEGEAKIQQAFMAMQEKGNEQLKQAETDFLAANSKNPGVTITSSGLQYEVLREGSGEKPSGADTVKVNYRGTLTNGTEFDSSPPGQPVEFVLDEVIPGWTEGIQLMNVGSKYKFYIPSELAYGPYGAGSTIPPYSTLIFEVELLETAR